MSPVIVGGRYGLSSKDTDPTQIIAALDNLAQETPKNNFTIGINDDVTHLSLPLGPRVNPDGARQLSFKFWGLGGDGTVGANKNHDRHHQQLHEQIRPGLLRVRREEILRRHDIAPALLRHADTLVVPRQARGLRSGATTRPTSSTTT